VSIHLPAHSSGSGGSSNAAHHHHQDEIRVGSATSNTVADSVKAAQNLSTAVPATVAVAIPHQEENNQPPPSNQPSESHHAPAQGVVVLSSLVEPSIAPVVAALPTADYSHYNSKLTIQDFDLLKVRSELLPIINPMTVLTLFNTIITICRFLAREVLVRLCL
jgi:hypothetical protein